MSLGYGIFERVWICRVDIFVMRQARCGTCASFQEVRRQGMVSKMNNKICSCTLIVVDHTDGDSVVLSGYVNYLSSFRLSHIMMSPYLTT